MDAINLNIDPEAINRYVADKIIESALGPQVKSVIDATVKQLMSGFNNPIEPAIKRAVADIIEETLKAQYRPQLEAKVREHVALKADTLIDDLIAKVFSTIAAARY